MDKPRSCCETINEPLGKEKHEKVPSTRGIALDVIRTSKKLEALMTLLENDEIYIIIHDLDQYKSIHQLIAVELIERGRGAAVACYLSLFNVDHSLVADLLIETGRADAVGMHWDNFTKLNRSHYEKKLKSLGVLVSKKNSSK